MYASLAVCQLLIIKGKKIAFKFKSTCGSVVFAVLVGMLFAIEIGVLTNLNVELLGCTDFKCPAVEQRDTCITAKNTALFSYYVTIVWLPSFVILLISTSWSYIVFKKHYTGGDDQLNRRLLSMPVILPAVLVLSTLASYIIRRFVFGVILAYEMKFVQYWLFVSEAVTTLMSDILDGILYQLLLTYLNPHLFNAWKELFHRKRNVVHPQT